MSGWGGCGRFLVALVFGVVVAYFGCQFWDLPEVSGFLWGWYNIVFLRVGGFWGGCVIAILGAFSLVVMLFWVFVGGFLGLGWWYVSFGVCEFLDLG